MGWMGWMGRQPAGLPCSHLVQVRLHGSSSCGQPLGQGADVSTAEGAHRHWDSLEPAEQEAEWSHIHTNTFYSASSRNASGQGCEAPVCWRGSCPWSRRRNCWTPWTGSPHCQLLAAGGSVDNRIFTIHLQHRGPSLWEDFDRHIF